MTAVDLRHRVRLLETERFAAVEHGLDANATYMDDLNADLVAMRHAYVGAAVTEIAVLRAQLDAPLVG